jgi:phosphomevalonate kinase
MRFSASAPGKVVLAGEYAVLQGAPAISMAVDCRARVTVESTGDDWHSVVSPGVADTARFRGVERGAVEWGGDERVNPDHKLLEHVWRLTQALPSQGLALTLDTRRFFDPESSLKLGFGSSSALATALTAALARAGCTEAGGSPDICAMATRAHLSFQDGRGSGVDVATAVSGGIIAFTMRPDQRIRTLKWPQGLSFSILWSGKPASTAGRLQQLERFERGRAARMAAAKLQDASRGVLDAWLKDRPTAILESLQIYTAALRRFSIEHGLGVFGAGHQELCEMADDFGFVYKPCGAGGGDVGIVFFPVETVAATVAEFGSRAGQLGFRRLGRTMEAQGLIYEH